jgi:hypothetical protein
MPNLASATIVFFPLEFWWVARCYQPMPPSTIKVFIASFVTHAFFGYLNIIVVCICKVRALPPNSRKNFSLLQNVGEIH